jgi:hypothetical protein
VAKVSKGGWSVPREWAGETAFIIGGGPSVLTQNVAALDGRKVIAINSSYTVAPFAQYVFAGDSRWLHEHKAALLKFKGQVVTCGQSVFWPGMLCLRKATPIGVGISTDPKAVVFRRTSLHGGINLAVLLGAKRIVLLGADGKANGKLTHHHQPHRWPVRDGCWDKQRKDLVTIRKPLRDLNVELINASPDSAWDMWPFGRLEDYL